MRVVVFALAPVAVPLVLIATGCDTDDSDPATPSVPGVPYGPGDDDSTTSSLPGPGATNAPNPDAGSGGPVTSTP